MLWLNLALLTNLPQGTWGKETEPAPTPSLPGSKFCPESRPGHGPAGAAFLWALPLSASIFGILWPSTVLSALGVERRLGLPNLASACPDDVTVLLLCARPPLLPP